MEVRQLRPRSQKNSAMCECTIIHLRPGTDPLDDPSMADLAGIKALVSMLGDQVMLRLSGPSAAGDEGL